MKVIFDNYKKVGKKSIIGHSFYIHPERWYMEYHHGIRLNFIFCFMIKMFPIFIILRWDDPHAKNEWYDLDIQFLFFQYIKSFKSFGSVKECNAYIKWQRRHI